MKLDPDVLADLAVAFEPTAYLRAMPLVHRKTPLGMGEGPSRFASPDKSFKLLYIAEDLPTSLAECLIRDRFENRKRRRLSVSEAESWGVSEITAATPLVLIDIRTTGLLRLGAPTDAAHAKRHSAGRRLSQSIYAETTAAGLLYRSRLTGGTCCAIYDRAVSQLRAGRVVDVVSLVAFVPALQTLDVEIVATMS